MTAIDLCDEGRNHSEPGGRAAGVTAGSERSARRIVAALTGAGVLVSESSLAPLRLASPAALAARWMPGLLPGENRLTR